MAEDLQSAQQKLDALFAEFAKKLDEKVGQIAAAVDDVRSAGEDDFMESIRAASGLAHKLAGSAGSFGYAELSSISSEMEVYCEELMKTAAPDAVAGQKKLGEYVSQMQMLAKGKQETMRLASSSEG